MFPIAQRHIAQAVLVGDAAIRDAQRRLWDVLRIAAEPGGAAALAAFAFGNPPGNCRRRLDHELRCGAAEASYSRRRLQRTNADVARLIQWVLNGLHPTAPKKRAIADRYV